MNQFEKWAKEKGYDLWRHSNDSWEYGYVQGAEEGWRAALEWISREARSLEKQPESPIDAFDLIEEELKK